MSEMPGKPLVVFDGDCDFCGLWLSRWRKRLTEKLDFAPFQEVAADYPDIPRDNFSGAVHLIMPDGTVYSGAHAVLGISAATGRGSPMLWIYRNVPGAAPLADRFYRWIATHRDFGYRTCSVLWGCNLGPHEYTLVRWLFLRVLGVIYLVAFGSFASQALGLIGSGGILPVADYLDAVTNSYPTTERFTLLPTLLWLDSGDVFIQLLCFAGIVLSALLIIGVLSMPTLGLLWVLYLSLVVGGQEFMSFQWDNLLLETGFLAIFLAPLSLLPRLSRQRAPSFAVIFLFRFLLFRLMFMSGLAKLVSGDPTWSSLTALDYHYWTQPLPTPLAWFAAQLPPWAAQLSTLGTLAIELVVPFMYFLPRRVRFLAAFLTILLQVMIILTGNYTFFNWLTIALCLFLYDDDALQRLVPRRIRGVVQKPAPLARHAAALALAVVVIFFGSLQVLSMADQRINPAELPGPLASANRLTRSLRIVNPYGLFARMTRSRPEIIIEGSNDGENWRAYEFRYKAGDLYQMPAIVAPHQPRLDWQMWFAALGSRRFNLWFDKFVHKLLLGRPEVIALLEYNPFPDGPPAQVRARLFQYQFSDADEHGESGAWWSREFMHFYLPPVTLQDFGTGD